MPEQIALSLVIEAVPRRASNRKGERADVRTDAGPPTVRRDSRAQIKENLCFANGDAWAASNAEVSTTLRGNGDLIPRRVCVSCCDAPDRRCRIIVPFEKGDRTTFVTNIVRYWRDCISITRLGDFFFWKIWNFRLLD